MSEPLSADEANDGLNTLNEMMGSWSNESLLTVSRVRESFNISAGTSYTIGAGQTLNTIRPIAIKEAFIRIAQNDYYLEPLTDEQYAEIGFKSLSTNIPSYYNYNNAYPYGTITLYPALSAAAALHLLSEKAITSFPLLTTTVDLPAGWIRALRYNLAIDLAPEYGMEIPQQVLVNAASSKNAIALAIAKNRPMKFDDPDGVYEAVNIYSGGY